jgi:hypothetical protein
MKWDRKFPLVTCVLAGLGLCIGIETGALVHYAKVSRLAVRELDRCEQEMNTLTAASPATTTQSAASIAADVARTAARLAAVEGRLVMAGDAADRMKRAAVPTGRSEAFFDIATGVEALRHRAVQAGVVLKPDERFGFSSYANEAPLAGQITDVFRQRQLVQYLVEALIDAKPRELLSVQLERPADELRGGAVGKPVATRAHRAAGPGNESDYFAIDPRISVRAPGVIATRAFRLSFTGHTATLRMLLNRLATFELPLVVRAVEVTSPEQSTLKRASTESAALVVPPWSRFSVTVEFLQLSKLRSTAS